MLKIGITGPQIKNSTYWRDLNLLLNSIWHHVLLQNLTSIYYKISVATAQNKISILTLAIENAIHALMINLILM